MKKQRKRVSTRVILEAANWVRENIHNLADRQLTKTQWSDLLSEGVGEQFTVATALEILSSNGVNVTPPKPVDPMEVRVLSLEQAVSDLVRTVAELQRSPYDEPDEGLLPLKSYPQKTYTLDNESEVADVFSRM